MACSCAMNCFPISSQAQQNRVALYDVTLRYPVWRGCRNFSEKPRQRVASFPLVKPREADGDHNSRSHLAAFRDLTSLAQAKRS